MKTVLRFLFATCVVSVLAWAQQGQSPIPESYVALLRSDIQTQKTALITQNLTLSDDQAKKFWPLQRSYESELSKLGDERLDVIRTYVKSWDNLDDATAKNLGKRLLEYHKKRIDLESKYFDRMSKEISPTLAAKFFQIELQLEDIIDLDIASSVPLIK
jgi:hypothetical protein